MTEQPTTNPNATAASRYADIAGPVFVMVDTAFDADNWKPRLVDAGDLRTFVDGAHRAGEGHAPFADKRLFWFAADGSPVECVVEYDRNHSTTYNDDDYATAVYHVMTPRGTALATFQISIDGRA